MFNGDKANIGCQFASNSCDIRFFNGVPIDCDYSSISWKKRLPGLKIFQGIISHSDSQESQNTFIDNNKSEYNESLLNNDETANSGTEVTFKTQSKFKSIKSFKPKITIMKIKTMINNETLNDLPTDVRGYLISLLPDCDKIIAGETSEDRHVSLSNSALDNEFYHKALIRYLLKVTNGQSLVSIESFINRIKSSLPKPLRKTTKTKSDSILDDCDDSPNTTDIYQSESSIIKLDCNISDNKVNYQFGVESPISVENREFDDLLNTKQENEISFQKYSFDSSFKFNIRNGLNSRNNCNKSKLESIHKDFPEVSSNHNDSLNVPKNGKYKRRNSESGITPIQNKRPTRSTAGQLPARLKSYSPQPGYQANTMSSLLNRSHSPKTGKQISGRKKSKEKRKYKTPEYNRQSSDHTNIKPASIHSDTILLNLRTKLSNRMQKNALKQYPDQYQKTNFPFEINDLGSQSPRSLSPESDKIAFVNSPLSKNGHNNLRQMKYKNHYFENQSPNSPQWSFSSEFTSQSSVESVLSQKNVRIDLEEVSAPENLLDDVDSEEMPPPRRTLTVATMREKMRAKKMAKEEKRKDFDKDFSFDVDKNDDSSSTSGIDMYSKNSHISDISNMMGLPPDNEDNEDDNMANEFDSFLIDDYHVEMDDKILNYSDDLDDLLLSGGNESLLEIIMKDPDAMEIPNDNFSILNSDCPTVSSEHLKCSLNDSSNIQSRATSFNNRDSDLSNGSSSSLNCKPSVSASSVCRIDNSILSQALTSVIEKSDTIKSTTKEAAKSALQNAYLVDGNGLSDALKLIQSMNPGAKVTTQQFFLVNSGPQLVLSQAPPTQACSLHTNSVQSPIKPQPITSRPITHNIPSTAVTAPPVPNTLILTNSKPTPVFNPTPILSSSVSVLPQLSAFNTKPSNLYSLNSNFSTKFVTSVGTKLSVNNYQYQQSTMSSTNSLGTQQPNLFSTSNHVLSNPNIQNTIGIRLQLGQNFQSGQPLNLIQQSPSGHSQMIPTLISHQNHTPSLQFINPQQQINKTTNAAANSISLLNQSKLVLLYPNLNCSDLIGTQKTDNQQLILLSQTGKDQGNPIALSTGPTFQVVNGPNIWHQINPGLGTLLGTGHPGNNLVLMNTQALNGQQFSFNYQQPSPLITTGSNLLMMSSCSSSSSTQPTRTTPLTSQYKRTSSLTVTVNKSDNDDKSHTNLNSNSSQNSCVEQLSNSSSSANSKLSSFDDKSSCQLSKSQSDIFTDSDQEKSISSPQFQLFNTESYINHQQHAYHSQQQNYQQINSATVTTTSNQSALSNGSRSVHLSVDLGSSSPSNNKISTKSNHRSIQSPSCEYDQCDFEIPCLYSQKLLDSSTISTNISNNNDYVDDNMNN